MQTLYDTKTAAPLIGIRPSTLENWRTRGSGPRFYKSPGRQGRVLYDAEAIAEWLAERSFRSTSEATAADA